MAPSRFSLSALGIVAQQRNCTFVAAIGDNFYEAGVTNENDPRFNQTYVGAYQHPALQVPWSALPAPFLPPLIVTCPLSLLFSSIPFCCLFLSHSFTLQVCCRRQSRLVWQCDGPSRLFRQSARSYTQVELPCAQS